MDSLTQITFGAAVGEAVLGRQLGNRAIFWGAVGGTLPDLDIVLTPLLDPVQFVVHHRGLSHSLLAIAVVTPALSWFFTRWFRRAVDYWPWSFFFLLVFLTHILLDCCTNYGTQIFAPFSDIRVAWNNIFIIDPIFTLPLLVGVCACSFLNRQSRARRAWNHAGLILSVGYLAATFAAQFHARGTFDEALARQHIHAHRFMTCPTPFNSVLWYCVAEVDDGYCVGFYSLLDSTKDIRFRFVKRQEELLADFRENYGIGRLIWFADGYYCVREHPNGIVLHVMKFGSLNLAGEPEQYPFSYLIRLDSKATLIIESDAAGRHVNLGRMADLLWTRLKGI